MRFKVKFAICHLFIFQKKKDYTFLKFLKKYKKKGNQPKDNKNL